MILKVQPIGRRRVRSWAERPVDLEFTHRPA